MITEGKEKDTCNWELCGESLWASDCGHRFQFMDDGPEENGFKFCPYCSKKIVEILGDGSLLNDHYWKDLPHSGMADCPHCEGTGYSDDPLFDRPCWHCDGTGEVTANTPKSSGSGNDGRI